MNKVIRAYVASNGAIAFGTVFIDATLYWLLYAIIQNPILYIPVAAAQPISKLAFSYIAGYIVDKYDKKVSVTLYGTLVRVSGLLAAIFIAFNNPLLAVIFFLVRWIAGTFSEIVIQTVTITNVPKEEIAKLNFYLRLTKEPSEIVASLIWPFVLPHLQAWTIAIGVVISEIGVGIRGHFTPSEKGKRKEISLKDGALEYIRNKVIFSTGIPLIIAQGALSMVYLYYAAIIQILNGTPLEYSLARIMYSASFVIGGWIGIRIRNPSTRVILTFISYIITFLALIPKNPWLLTLSLFGVGFGDEIYATLLYMSFRTVRAEIFGSIAGFDELVTNAVRVGYNSLAGFLYDTVYDYVPVFGLVTIAAFGLLLYKNQHWKTLVIR